jgi:RNA polymerase sigma factor (sigma-70 family)
MSQVTGADHPDSVAALVQRARDGDQAAWDALVDRFLPLVTAVVARHRLTGPDAQDVNQTVWLRVVEHLAGIREPRALPGWIATTTRHECLAQIRRRGRSTPVDPLDDWSMDRAADQPPVDADLLLEERHQALRDGLAEIPEDRRRLLELLATDPAPSYDEISRTLGIPVGSIGPTRARALDQLRRTPSVRALLEPWTVEGGASRARLA